MAIAPRTNSARSPLCRAKRIENDVIGTSGGVSPATFRKRLRVGHHQRRRALQAVQRVAQLALLDDQAVGVVVEQVADASAPAAGSAGPWAPPGRWHDQHGQLARRHQVADDGRAR